MWKLIWLAIRWIDENSWFPSSVGHDIHLRMIDYFRQPGYSPNNCNGTNSASKRFVTLYVTVLYKRNWICQWDLLHRFSTPLLYLYKNWLLPRICCFFNQYDISENGLERYYRTEILIFEKHLWSKWKIIEENFCQSWLNDISYW